VSPPSFKVPVPSFLPFLPSVFFGFFFFFFVERDPSPFFFFFFPVPLLSLFSSQRSYAGVSRSLEPAARHRVRLLFPPSLPGRR